jgi:glycosyltransferase involved in cell wall biosynthesis
MPPAPTGVADYAAALFSALRRSGDVELGDPRGRSKPDEIALYHIGNNHLHREIYQRALDHPGVVVLHDAVLQHFFLGTLEERGYAQEFVFNYGEWMRDMAGELWRNRARSAADPRYFAYPMLKRVAARSLGVIVHNPAAAAAVQRHAPDARVFEIPHLFDGPRSEGARVDGPRSEGARVEGPRELPDTVETLRFRNALGLGPRTLLVSVFGHMRESKRLPSIVRAMNRVWDAGGDARLLIAGAFASSDLERAAGAWLDDPRILRTGYLSEDDFWRYAAATDLCVNLRFPAACETSGIAIRLMGIGKAVVFTEGHEIARIPENACLRVDAGEAEEEMLARMIGWLAGDGEAAVEIGKRAAEHIAREHGIEKVAQQYWEAIRYFDHAPHDDRGDQMREAGPSLRSG